MVGRHAVTPPRGRTCFTASASASSVAVSQACSANTMSGGGCGLGVAAGRAGAIIGKGPVWGGVGAGRSGKKVSAGTRAGNLQRRNAGGWQVLQPAGRLYVGEREERLGHLGTVVSAVLRGQQAVVQGGSPARGAGATGAMPL